MADVVLVMCFSRSSLRCWNDSPFFQAVIPLSEAEVAAALRAVVKQRRSRLQNCMDYGSRVFFSLFMVVLVVLLGVFISQDPILISTN